MLEDVGFLLANDDSLQSSVSLAVAVMTELGLCVVVTDSEWCVVRNEFDEDRVPDLEAEVYQQDIHSVSSLVKMYFRELPNPLLTYQLYDKFAVCVIGCSHFHVQL